ncbi:LarC family nickel insertion protein [Anoxybacterium hadale]|uniref:LarC family nickel insertion protein n=1 Tax=Anoxybacterium hadale TaxID=3408580 RepID=A0ACD1ACQ1_9FIRM|nr:LarC family nickel insertion protein [Clostridiales bacterium]
MKILYLDCTSGISGDMTLGALLDLGVDKDFFLQELSKLGVDGYEVKIQKKDRHSIQMMDVDVILTEQSHMNHENAPEAHEHSSEHDYSHEQQDHHHGYDHDHSHKGHDHHHDHGHSHEGNDHHHDHGHSHEGNDHHHNHSHSNERNLSMIQEIIDNSTISNGAKEISKKIFEEIARAEAKVHGKSIDQVHFHEVGAIDSIVDIVGVAICVAALDVDIIYASTLHDGNGFIQCRHGLLPVPVPAVMAMLEGSGIPMVQEDVNTEMITPTGMGIVKCLAKDYIKIPEMSIDKIGYGLGKRETGRFGAVRAILGTTHQLKSMDAQVE